MQSRGEKMLVGAAQVVGKVAGKIAGLVGAKTEPDDRQGNASDLPPNRKASKSAKPEKKQRPHVPRRQKKAQKKMDIQDAPAPKTAAKSRRAKPSTRANTDSSA